MGIPSSGSRSLPVRYARETPHHRAAVRAIETVRDASSRRAPFAGLTEHADQPVVAGFNPTVAGLDGRNILLIPGSPRRS